MGSCYSSHSGKQQSFDSNSRPFSKKLPASGLRRSKLKRKSSRDKSSLASVDGSDEMMSSKAGKPTPLGNQLVEPVKRKTGSKLPKFGLPKTNKVRDIVEKHEAREKQVLHQSSSNGKKAPSESQSVDSCDNSSPATRSSISSSESSATSVIAVQNLQPQACVQSVQIETQNVQIVKTTRNVNNNQTIINGNQKVSVDQPSNQNDYQNDVLNANVKPVIPTTNVRFLNNPPQQRNQIKIINSRLPPAKFTTHISGLPKPQTAQVISTSESLRRFALPRHSSSPPPSVPPPPSAIGSTNVNLSQAATREQTQLSNRNDQQIPRPGLGYHGPCPYRRPVNNLNVAVNKTIAPAPSLGLVSAKKATVVLSKTFEVHKETREPEVEKKTEAAREVPKYLPVFSRYTPSSNYFPTSNARRERDARGTSRMTEPDKDVNRNLILDSDRASSLGNQLSPEHVRGKDGISLSDRNSEPASCDSSIANTSAKNSPERISSVGSSSDRDFLIDDEISDQPELVLSTTVDQSDTTIRHSLHELEVLRNKQNTEISSSSSATSVNSSPCTVISSTNFRKPRALSVIESPDGSCMLDGSSFRNLLQDMNGIKTLLFRLQGLLQNAETQNPFDYQMPTQRPDTKPVAVDEQDDFAKEPNVDAVMQENLELKRQLSLLKQQNDEKQRTIRLLQQQMTKYMSIDGDNSPGCFDVSNAATQTERSYPNGLSPRAMSDGSNGMLISDGDKLINGDCYPCLLDHDT